jgi:hypothetical protein
VGVKDLPMADDKHNTGPRDGKRISLTEDYEVRYWTNALGVSKEKLVALVQEHGNSAERIRRALGKENTR